MSFKSINRETKGYFVKKIVPIQSQMHNEENRFFMEDIKKVDSYNKLPAE